MSSSRLQNISPFVNGIKKQSGQVIISVSQFIIQVIIFSPL